MNEDSAKYGNEGNRMTWDGYECPNDCSGELQQQDRFNVMCLECEDVWTHMKSDDAHWLQQSSGYQAAVLERGEIA